MTFAKLTAALIFLSSTCDALTAAAYRQQRPKLVVMIVVDQLRGDLLTRFENKFAPPGTPKQPGGFRFLMENGAWFPFAEYEVLQAMTCPGHATIATGSWPATHGIGTNDWWDPAARKVVYCSQDENDQTSPRRLRGSTFGDELKNAHPNSRVVSIASKERSAVMLGGRRADIALWMNAKTSRWVSSAFYPAPPAWTKTMNDAIKEAPADFRSLEAQIENAKTTFAVALSAVRGQKLGRGADPDLLAISISAHDAVGHRFGPDSPEMAKMIVEEDRFLKNFLGELAKHVPLEDVVITLTADHGVAPTAEKSLAGRQDVPRFDLLALTRKLNARLDEKFGSAGKTEWITGGSEFQFHLNQSLLKDRKIAPSAAQAEVKDVMLKEPGVLAVFTRDDFDRGQFPVGPLGQQLRNAYVPGQSGDVILIQVPFMIPQDALTANHISGWSYDRSVPLILFGKPFKPGVASGAKVVDLAATLSFTMGVLPPALCQGRVLGEVMR